MASVLKVDKLDPQSGTALELGTSGDTISIPSGATLDISASTLTPPATMPASSGINLTALNATNLGSGTVPTARLGTGTASSSTVLYGDQTYKTEPSGGTNSPYFFARRSNTGQSIANDTYGTIIFDTEHLDSAGTYDTGTGLWTPGTIGKYFCFAQVAWGVTDGEDWISGTAIIDKNSAGYTDTNMKSAIAYTLRRASGSSTSSFYVSQIFDLNATDTVRVQFQGGWSGASSHETVGYGKTYFGGYKLA